MSGIEDFTPMIYSVNSMADKLARAAAKRIAGLLEEICLLRGSRNGRGQGGHSIEPNPYSKVNYNIKRSIDVYR